MLARRTAILLLIGQHYVMCYTSYCLKLQTQLAMWNVSQKLTKRINFAAQFSLLQLKRMHVWLGGCTPPPCAQTRHLWKHILSATTLADGKMRKKESEGLASVGFYYSNFHFLHQPKIPQANRTEFNQEMQIRFQTVTISIADRVIPPKTDSTVLYGSQTL